MLIGRCFLSSVTAKAFTGLDCILEYHNGCLITNRNCLPFASTWVHPGYFDGVRVANRFSVLCPYFLSFMLWCPLRFPHKSDVRFVFTSSYLWQGSCLIYVICVCLPIVVYNTYYFVFFGIVCLPLVSCVPNIAIFSGLSILNCPFGFL